MHSFKSPLAKETHLGAFHNSPVDSSEKSAENPSLPVENSRSLALKLAAELARQLGMTRTWPNLQTIRLAIESEADYSGISIRQAAAVIAMAANYQSGCYDVCPSSLDQYLAVKDNTIDRFWFEDSRWRNKGAYIVFMARLQEATSP
jgi:hypothetical protein